MKLRTALALTLGVLLLGVPFATSAQSPSADLEVGDGSGLPGATGINITVSLTSHDAEVWGTSFDVTYDDTQLEFVSAVQGSAVTDDKSFTSSHPSPNVVRVLIFDLNSPAVAMGDGSVAVITFDVLPSASPGSYDLTLEDYSVTDLDEQELAVNPLNGTFTVEQPAATDTPTETPTDTLTPTESLTPIETPTPTETRTPTRTKTRTPSPTVTATGPSRTPSRTPTITLTPTRTQTPTRTKYVSPTPTLTGTLTITPETATPGGAGTLVIGLPRTSTPTTEGGNFIDLRGPAGTQTAQAKFDQDVAATATALAGKGEGGGDLVGNLLDTLLKWAIRNATWLVLGGMGVGALIIAVWMGIAIFREPKKK